MGGLAAPGRRYPASEATAPPPGGRGGEGPSAKCHTLSVVESANGESAIRDGLSREYREMIERAARSRERAERLRALAEQAQLQADTDDRLARDLAEVLGLDPQINLSELDERLRGQRVREVAVKLLVELGRVNEPIHYRDWFELLRSHGYDVIGKDPLATFLAHVSRAAGVEGVGKRSGLYLVRAA